MTTIVKSKMIKNANYANLIIKTSFLQLLDASRSVMVPSNVLSSLTMKEVIDEITNGEHPLSNLDNFETTSKVEPSVDNLIPNTQINSNEEIPYGKLEEKVNLEEVPAQTINETIAAPSIEEINVLRGVLADASNKITKLQNNLDELQQLLQTTLDSGKEFIEDRGMNM